MKVDRIVYALCGIVIIGCTYADYSGYSQQQVSAATAHHRPVAARHVHHVATCLKA